MRFNLCLTHWSLFYITLISSCFLFFVVAKENAKYVAAQAAAGSTNFYAASADVDASVYPFGNDANTAEETEADSVALNSDEPPHERVLPNYKKVKKVYSPPPAGVYSERGGTAGPIAPNPKLHIAAGIDVAPLPTNEETATAMERNLLYAEQSVDVEDLSMALPSAVESINDVAADMSILGETKECVIISEIVQNSKPISDMLVPEQRTQSIDHIDAMQLDSQEILPDISDLPTITTVHEVTELPLDVLEPTLNGVGVESLTIDVPVVVAEAGNAEKKNKTLESLMTGHSEEKQKDEEIVKIDDSGGDTTAHLVLALDSASTESPSQGVENASIENADANNSSSDFPTNTTRQEQPGTEEERTHNVPVEAEVPIPVFSEWAQKQMEAAEKQQQLEQEQVVNTSTQKKNQNNTNGNNKLPPLKLRAKNYASPDCGAKIIASNADATNTGAVLSSSKDEYMLSPCTNRIWFVVELCEAIQAQKIDLANFELFSSSPHNFTVAVSNRFPTRDWSNVGRFIAEDKRTIQSFDLHPHLFGKFVRVDIHSHYSKEHFCPVSLFRVFGTSEFEAFETENHPNEDMDDFDDEFALEQAHAKNSENNLFKSASDAVLSIVKKAAEVLAKPVNNMNSTLTMSVPKADCHTPAFGQFSCSECNNALVERVNVLLSCKTKELYNLLSIQRLRNDLLNTQFCAKNYGIKIKQKLLTQACNAAPNYSEAIQQSYFLNLLPNEYVGALCQLVAERTPNASVPHVGLKHGNDDAELALNLTIDKKLTNSDFKNVESVKETKKKLISAAQEKQLNLSARAVEKETKTQANDTQYTTEATTISTTTTTEPNSAQDVQLVRPPQTEPETPTTLSPTDNIETISQDVAKDVNIFNLNVEDATASELEVEKEYQDTQPIYEGSADHSPHSTMSTEQPLVSSSPSTTERATISTEDPSSWDSIDNLLSSTTVSPGITVAGTGSNGQPVGIGAANGGLVINSINMQQKIPNGPHSESIFIRLSNRIKALERNMSLSGQYLEELSRRYKKQVEDLQQTLTQQTTSVRALEEQNRRHSEFEQLLSQRNLQLKDELDDLTLQVHACIVVIIFVGAFVFLVAMVGILFIRSMRRETRELVKLQAGATKRKTSNICTAFAVASANKRKLNRRKSFEDFSDHQQTLNSKAAEKQRRPSEEAMLILKECAGDANLGDRLCKAIEKNVEASKDSKLMQPRQRKISICYSNNNNSSNCNFNGHTNRITNSKRKGEKHSWPNSEQQHLEELNATEDYDKFAATGLMTRPFVGTKLQLPNSSSSETTIGQRSKSSKKKLQHIKRQVSAPTSSIEYAALPAAASTNLHSFDAADSLLPLNQTNSDYDENLMLDEDDLDNFLPVADLAYNEFMPDGPSGYQISATSTCDTVNANKAEKAASKKAVRRLSSPAFFKSPFSKSLKSKSPIMLAPKPPHESTSWEWYRSKKSDSHKHTTAAAPIATKTGSNRLLISPFVPASGCFHQQTSPAPSVDSSSLSEIHFPTNSNENSFRILEEAILSSTSTSNGNGNGSSSGGSSSIRSSSTTSSKKKKNRSFNKIFRKVF